MIRGFRNFIVALLVALGACRAPAQEDPVRRELQRALEQLDATRAQIAEDKLPLAEKVAALEAELIDARRRMEETRRAADNRSLELNQLRNDIKSREQEQQYLISLFGEYLRNLESRLHIAELRRHEKSLREARAVIEQEDAPPPERYAAAIGALDRSIARLEELVGGARFSGQATGDDGRLRNGTFALIGPVAYFTADAEDLTGVVEQRLGSLEPSVAPFADPLLTEQLRGLLQEGKGLLPFDASLGNARKIEATKETVWEHIQKGGAVIWPILAMAALILSFSLIKWIRLSLVRLPKRRILDRLLAAVRVEPESAVSEQLQRLRGPAGRILRAGWSRRGASKDVVEEAMFAEMLELRFSYNRGLPFIAVGAACAPLLGLLGTVTGIIATFKLITVFGSGDVKMLSAGISEALITTEFGLLVAIPSLLLHAFLSRKARALVEKLEQLAIAFLGALGERQPAPAAPTPPAPRKDAPDASQTNSGLEPASPAPEPIPAS